MKKIEELLHTEMQNKKTIHELRLHKESKSFTDSDTHSLNRIVRKREKELQEQIQLLELEREGLLSGLAGLKEKVRYLESKLNVSDDELRKMLEEKRNYEELIRMEKDKLMNL